MTINVHERIKIAYQSIMGGTLSDNGNVAAATLFTPEGERTYFALSKLHNIPAEKVELFNNQLGPKTVICPLLETEILSEDLILI